VAATEDAYELALKALGYKERTESELRTWLTDRGVEEAEIEPVIALLAEAGAIDDASFARRYAADKQLLAGWGPDRITKALAGRGWTIAGMRIGWRAKNPVSVADPAARAEVEEFLTALDEDDDVQHIYVGYAV
jgi:transcriptional/translational regulatory protein YebC/TACO1